MITNKNNRGTIVPHAMMASAIIGLLTLTSVMFLPNDSTSGTAIYIQPAELTIEKDKLFSIEVIVTADKPVNAFAGVLEFDENILLVDRIEYNTSIADLWAQEPWFYKGSGTISFAGGSTKAGGFSGTGSLVTVYFKGLSAETTSLKLSGTRVLQHDGLGTDATLNNPIDALFTITTDSPSIDNSPDDQAKSKTDLNKDGKTTIADISIFMIDLTTQNLQADFNNDSKVNTADLSIILDARR